MDEGRVPPVDLRQLHYFVAIAEQGSISSAAAVLGLAQPSLSEHISRLERKLDTQLIIRGARGVHLTEAGVALAQHAREILHGVEVAVEDVRHLGGEARGPVSIGFPPSMGLLLSVPLAETIQAEFPRVRLHIAEAMSGYIMEWIINERIELGCVYEVPDASQVSVQPILSEDLFLVTAPDNWDGAILPNGRAEKPITLADVQSLPLVLPSRPHGAREVIERFAKSNGVRLDVVTEIDSLPQIIAMADRASAYTILPHAAVINEVANGTLALVEIVKPTIRRTAYLIRKRSRSVTRASQVVEQELTTIIGEMIDRHHLEARLPKAE
ncbi:LysR family transcriptional regulator [Sphingobium subterraneum]|uniref:LysR family nitrogen assimilation transcriptional regulator n=1 Tax=Sphingobium subterraneum TaxID=627688 RepID=A0A841IWG1_9SPHN|nr:LysR family transcriptional regulator [Sphingobium subterraneum]MBB6122977.1 LysR family nitrogen assimilation transcriptional regulator [Sphingobium subterraneum]